MSQRSSGAVAVLVQCILAAGCSASTSFSQARLDASRASSSAELPPSRVRLEFADVPHAYAPARAEYMYLWARDGERIIATLERVAGVRFDSLPYADTLIRVVVFEGVSHSGYRDTPMQLRASYAEETKRATLVHELAHRLQDAIDAPGDNVHGMLFLWLYDAWVALWGREFADRQVAVERTRRGPYPAAWDSALALTRNERAARWRSHRDARRATWAPR